MDNITTKDRADLRAAAAHYDAVAAALRARLAAMNAEYNALTLEQQNSIDGIALALAAGGVQTALHEQQTKLFAVLSDLAPDRDL